MAAKPSKVSLKLLIDKKGKKVLFAEAGKDFVDFLFHILSMPLASVVKTISKNNMPGSLGRLYESIETMSDSLMQPDIKKSTILNPTTSNFSPKIPLLLATGTASCNMRDLYRCINSGTCSFGLLGNQRSNSTYQWCNDQVTNDPLATCPVCRKTMSVKMSFVAGPSCDKDEKAKTENQGGYVQGILTYD